MGCSEAPSLDHFLTSLICYILNTSQGAGLVPSCTYPPQALQLTEESKDTQKGGKQLVNAHIQTRARFQFYFHNYDATDGWKGSAPGRGVGVLAGSAEMAGHRSRCPHPVSASDLNSQVSFAL